MIKVWTDATEAGLLDRHSERGSHGRSAQALSDLADSVWLRRAVRLDPHRLELSGLRLDAFGGELAGDASLQDFARYKLNANLRHLDLAGWTRPADIRQPERWLPPQWTPKLSTLIGPPH